RIVRARRARGTGVLGAGVEDPAVVVEEVAARGAAAARGHTADPAAVRTHDVHLVALLGGTLPLKDQQLAGCGEIRFGVLPAECELAHGAKGYLSRFRFEGSLR